MGADSIRVPGEYQTHRDAHSRTSHPQYAPWPALARRSAAAPPPEKAAGGYFFRSPSRTRLSAVATMASSGERGAQPSRRLAFSPVAFLLLPSSGRICLTAGSRSAAMRTSQFGSGKVGTLLADA